MPDNNIRARLADALFPYLLYPIAEQQAVVDVLLSLSGIVVTEPITERCGAPGDTWECPACSTDWVAKSAGPLDIRWELNAAVADHA